ncbi:uncharacterized protein [Temnothorax nylanderi]|uniref:uncharacterized protein n=1 Tax=Temnothorax nylanderi TaxID=102681 RepID=UPI003A89D3BE
MKFNPYNVIMLLSATFTAFKYSPSPITSEEEKVKENIERMLLEIQNEEFYVEEEENLGFYDTYEIPEPERVDSFEEDDGKVYLPEEVICSSVEATISNDYKRQAVEYWRSGKTRGKSFEGVKRRFRKVTSIRQLRRWEIQISEGGSRLEKLEKIFAYTLNCFNKALERGIIIHDIDIARWASRAQEEENAAGFKASETWVKTFKITWQK